MSLELQEQEGEEAQPIVIKKHHIASTVRTKRKRNHKRM
jgi:hypothetical protein